MKKIFITGATGLVGKKIIKKILKSNKDYYLYILVRTKSKIEIDWAYNPKINIVYGNLNTLNTLKINNIDICLHLGAYIKNDIQELYRTNIQGTKNVIEFMKKNQIKRIIYLSSVSVFNGNKNCNNKKYKAKDDYGKSKIEAEKIVRNSNLNYIILRSGFIYDKNKYIDILLKRMERLKTKFVIGKNKFWHITYLKILTDLIFNLFEDNFKKNTIKTIADYKPIKIKDFYNLFENKIIYLNKNIYFLLLKVQKILKKFGVKKIDISSNLIGEHLYNEIYKLDYNWINKNLGYTLPKTKDNILILKNILI